MALREIAEGKIDRSLFAVVEAPAEMEHAGIPSPLDLPPDFSAPQFGLGE